jgi:hypothetical protein
MGNLLVAATGALALLAAPLVSLAGVSGVGSTAAHLRALWPETVLLGGMGLALFAASAVVARLPAARRAAATGFASTQEAQAESR